MSDDEEIPRDLCELNAEILEAEIFILQERCTALEQQANESHGNEDRVDALVGEYNRLVERIKQIRRLQEYFK